MRRRSSELDSAVLTLFSPLFLMFSNTTATDNRTYISLGDVEDDSDVDEDKIELLKKYNTGRIKSRNRADKKVVRRESYHATLEATSSSLRLNNYQKTKAKKILDRLLEEDIRGERIEEICFSICAIVANQDAKGKRWWNAGKEGNDERFEDFIERNDLKPCATFSRIRWRLNL